MSLSHFTTQDYLICVVTKLYCSSLHPYAITPTTMCPIYNISIRYNVTYDTHSHNFFGWRPDYSSSFIEPHVSLQTIQTFQVFLSNKPPQILYEDLAFIHYCVTQCSLFDYCAIYSHEWLLWTSHIHVLLLEILLLLYVELWWHYNPPLLEYCTTQLNPQTIINPKFDILTTSNHVIDWTT